MWSKVGCAYLAAGHTTECIDAFIRAQDTTAYLQVIAVAEQEQRWEHLVKYLLMCRAKIKDVNVDSSLAYCHAKLEKLGELEALIQGSNSVDLQRVGDRCFD